MTYSLRNIVGAYACQVSLVFAKKDYVMLKSVKYPSAIENRTIVHLYLVGTFSAVCYVFIAF